MISWFISASVSIASVPDYVQNVIPLDQSFETLKYAGIFHFRFWHYGEWVDVVVDDKLPVDSKDCLVFCYNQIDKNELFGSLLEKAYAKLNQCYEFLIGGNLIDALLDMTGGVHETFKLTESKLLQMPIFENSYQYLWDILVKSFYLRSLGGAVIKSNSEIKKEIARKSKLIVGKNSRKIILPISYFNIYCQ